ncbi:TetR/AcrR family transcriptional regulator [Paenibacillus rhizovicinus]|uniref:TetR/AcrR family transcriptional regulator n=1 Tax=Paenibacillus rhizovicinus TaxID=2704463 RepID=UPI001CDBEAE0|nr:TetR/AcrR family transcriptional regulator [Paenibacillus rhizovicinus]
MFKELLTQVKGERTVKQQRIVETAIRLFAEKGYYNTSTAEIAKAAEVSEGSIFKTYGTKDKLLLHLLVPNLKAMFTSNIDAVFREIGSGISFEAFLKALLKNRSDFFSENKEIFQILIKEIIYNEELKNDLLPYIAAVITPRISALIESAKKQGELVDLPTERIRTTLMTYFGGLFVSRFVLLNRSFISDEEIEDSVRMLMDGFRESSSPSPNDE